MSDKNDAYANTLITPAGRSASGPGGASSTSDSKAAQPVPASGEVLGDRYELGERIGSGGFGVVYEATDRRLQKRVAVKVLTRDSDDPQLVERFRAEALAAGKLHHPNIAGATDLDVSQEGRPYLVMELVEGEPLEVVIQREGPLEQRRAARIALGLSRALMAAHEAGIIHRDLKPANVMLRREAGGGETPKVLDFGLAKLLQVRDSATAALTDTGQVLGTPIYMAPEQIRGRTDLDGRADVYAVGVIFYEMLTGQTPFSKRSPGDVMVSKVIDKPEPPSHHVALPRDLDQLVLRAIDADPARRFSSAADLAAAIEPYTSDSSATSLRFEAAGRRPRWVYVVGAAVVLLGLGLGLYAVRNRHGASSDRRPAASPARTDRAATAPPAAPADRVDRAAVPTPPPPAVATADASPSVTSTTGSVVAAAPIDAGVVSSPPATRTHSRRRHRRHRRTPRHHGGTFFDSPRDSLRIP